MDAGALRIPLEQDGYAMQLRPSEVEAVGAGRGELDASEEGNLITVAQALKRLPLTDRAPLWELAIRHYGRHQPLEQAAGEIGMDAVHARTLLEAYSNAITQLRRPNGKFA